MNRQTYKWNRLTNNQVQAAKRFERKYGVSVSQAGKWLDWFFALERGEITKEQAEKETGLSIRGPE